MVEVDDKPKAELDKLITDIGLMMHRANLNYGDSMKVIQALANMVEILRKVAKGEMKLEDLPMRQS